MFFEQKKPGTPGQKVLVVVEGLGPWSSNPACVYRLVSPSLFFLPPLLKHSIGALFIYLSLLYYWNSFQVDFGTFMAEFLLLSFTFGTKMMPTISCGEKIDNWGIQHWSLRMDSLPTSLAKVSSCIISQEGRGHHLLLFEWLTLQISEKALMIWWNQTRFSCDCVSVN